MAGFADLARDTRVAAGKSLREVALALEFTPAYVSDIERGNRNPPAPEVARRWAKIIGADEDQFERASRLDRRAIELAVDRDRPESARNEAALALARSWDVLDEEDYSHIMDVLKNRKGNRGSPQSQGR